MKTYKKTVQVFRLVKEKTNIKTAKIRSSRDAHEFLKSIWDDDRDTQESFYVLFLNQANNIIGYKMISKGGMSATVIDVRLIAKYTLDSLASSVIIAHNHPSNTAEFSQDDRQVTEKIKSALKLFDISVLDHILMLEYGYTSYADEGI